MGVGDGGEGRGGVWDEGRGARAAVRRAKVRPGAEGQGPRQRSGVSGRSGGPEARSGVRRERGCRSRLRDRRPGSRRRLRRVRVLGGGRQAVGIPRSSGDASQPRPPRPFAALRRALDRAAALASSGRPPPLRPRPRGHSAPNSTASALRRGGPVAATGSVRKAGQVAGASGLQRRAGTAASGFPAPAARSQAPGSTSCPFSKDLSLIFSQRPTKTVNFHSTQSRQPLHPTWNWNSQPQDGESHAVWIQPARDRCTRNKLLIQNFRLN
ncbi:translation initiation factor IF-2-like [Mustela erminea]|uniref:translation initiation factor IF-2-like n=1 Tax=Mustela erminea TaxID=36723 RepID=UPI0013870606|nr:translation initiation factor IF-2-like [Mustela erminea]